jgi:hypothetical protein
MGEIFVGGHEGRLPCRLRRRWKHNIKTDGKGKRRENVDWINLVEDMDQWRTLVKTIMKRVIY